MADICDNYWMNQLDDDVDDEKINMHYNGECKECEYYEQCKEEGNTN